MHPELLKHVLSVITCADSVHFIFFREISIHKIFWLRLSDPFLAPDNNKVSCAAEAQ